MILIYGFFKPDISNICNGFSLSIYIYKTEAFEAPTIFHVIIYLFIF